MSPWARLRSKLAEAEARIATLVDENYQLKERLSLVPPRVPKDMRGKAPVEIVAFPGCPGSPEWLEKRNNEYRNRTKAV